MSGPDEIWVFGSFNGDGHHVYPVPRRQASPSDMYPVERACDSIGYPPSRGSRPEVEGECTPPRRSTMQDASALDGWSLVTWWDRQGDPRNGSHTGILAKGEWTDQQLVEAGRRLAPWAFRVKLGAWAGEAVS